MQQIRKRKGIRKLPLRLKEIDLFHTWQFRHVSGYPAKEAFLTDQNRWLAMVDDVVRLILFKAVIDGDDRNTDLETGEIADNDLRTVIEIKRQPVTPCQTELDKRCRHFVG